MRTLYALFGGLGLALLANADVDTIVTKGNHFFSSKDGTPFFIRGLIYDTFSSDSLSNDVIPGPLADGVACHRDVPILKSLNINTIWVYNIGLEEDHTECLSALLEAEIYIVLHLSDSSTLESWNLTMLERYTRTVDLFANYSNVLGFEVGFANTIYTMEYQSLKAAVRDVKQHLKDKNYRNIPIGWVGRGDEGASYMLCDADTADFLNVFNADLRNTTEEDVKEAIEYSETINVPYFLLRFQCASTSRPSDTPSCDAVSELFSDRVAEHLSGGLYVRYIDDPGQPLIPGLVEVKMASESDEVKPLPVFSPLSSVMATASPSFMDMSVYRPTAIAPSCPSGDSTQAVSPPPRPYAPLCSCVMSTLRCIAKPDVVEKITTSGIEFDNAITTLCIEDDMDNCMGVRWDPVKNQWGAFSTCNQTVAYAWVATQYWKRHGECDFDGAAELRDEQPQPQGDCTFLLEQVGYKGEYTLTAFLATSTTSSTTSSTTNSNPEPDPAGSASILPRKHVLSPGAIAGIAIGAVFAIVGVTFLVVMRLRRKQPNEKSDPAGGTPEQLDPPEWIPPHMEAQQNKHHPSDLPELRTGTVPRTSVHT